MDDIKGRIHVVTGGYGGIGTATARYLAELGGVVVVTGRNEDKGREAASAIARDTSGSVHFVPMDVLSPASVAHAVKVIEADIGPVFGLVANAGKHWLGETKSMSDNEWSDIMSTNVDGTFNTVQKFGASMRGRGGSIVLISSIASRTSGYPVPFASYGASKAAITHLARMLGVEWAAEGVRVNALEPGYTATNALATLEQDAPSMYEALMTRVPIRRLIRPEEVAHMIAFLLSDLSSAMTGSVLIADGGSSSL